MRAPADIKCWTRFWKRHSGARFTSFSWLLSNGKSLRSTEDFIISWLRILKHEQVVQNTVFLTLANEKICSQNWCCLLVAFPTCKNLTVKQYVFAISSPVFLFFFFGGKFYSRWAKQRTIEIYMYSTCPNLKLQERSKTMYCVLVNCVM